MTTSEKNSDTALRLLEILKILFIKDVTKHELINQLKGNKSFVNVYTQEAFIKYFSTLQAIGFNIVKEGRKYKLTNAMKNIELSNEEENLILKLLKNANKLYNKDLEEKIYNVFFKVQKFTNLNFEKEIEKIKNENTKISDDNIKNNIITTLVNYIQDKHLLSIKIQKPNQIEENVIAEIKNVTEKKGKIYLTFYNSSWGKNRKFALDNISEIKQLPKKSAEIKINNSYVFEVYGRLSKSYRLRTSEKVIDYGLNFIRISNEGEDRETFLLRLLKYGENCKIIKPLSLQKEFINLTNSILKNLEEV